MYRHRQRHEEGRTRAAFFGAMAAIMQRSSMWGLVALLSALAVLRSTSSEGGARALRKAVASGATVGFAKLEVEREELRALREEVQRERLALARWREDLEARQKTGRREEMAGDDRTDHGGVSADMRADDPDAFGGEVKEENANDFETSSKEGEDEASEPVKEYEDPSQATEVDGAEGGGTEEGGEDGESKVQAEPERTGDMEIAADVELAEDECVVILAPASSKAGLGIQIEHIWNSFSLALGIPGACMALPTVIAGELTENPKNVPFQQVFDVSVLANAGVRFVPLSVCKPYGVSAVFDDTGENEEAIVKQFSAYVKESHPELGAETTLVYGDTVGSRFLESSEGGDGIDSQTQHVLSKKPEGSGRYCAGIGRMGAQLEKNKEVLMRFVPAPSVRDFVSSKFENASSTLFVRLRWNQDLCSKASIEPGMVCVFTDTSVPVADYAHAIAFAADYSGASDIYISVSSHVPEEILAFLNKNLRTLDPVVLDVRGDVFAASAIERELAVRSMVFVPDGGAWSDCVQESRIHHNPGSFDPELNSVAMIQKWKDSGSPRQSLFLISPQDVQGDMPSEVKSENRGDKDQKEGSEESESITDQNVGEGDSPDSISQGEPRTSQSGGHQGSPSTEEEQRKSEPPMDGSVRQEWTEKSDWKAGTGGNENEGAKPEDRKEHEDEVLTAADATLRHEGTKQEEREEHEIKTATETETAPMHESAKGDQVSASDDVGTSQDESVTNVATEERPGAYSSPEGIVSAEEENPDPQAPVHERQEQAHHGPAISGPKFKSSEEKTVPVVQPAPTEKPISSVEEGERGTKEIPGFGPEPPGIQDNELAWPQPGVE